MREVSKFYLDEQNDIHKLWICNKIIQFEIQFSMLYFLSTTQKCDDTSCFAHLKQYFTNTINPPITTIYRVAKMAYPGYAKILNFFEIFNENVEIFEIFNENVEIFEIFEIFNENVEIFEIFNQNFEIFNEILRFSIKILRFSMKF